MRIDEIIHAIDTYVKKNEQILCLTSEDRAILNQLKASLRDLSHAPEHDTHLVQKVVTLIENAALAIARPIPHPVLSKHLQSIIDYCMSEGKNFDFNGLENSVSHA